MQALDIVFGKPTDRLDLIRNTTNVRFKGTPCYRQVHHHTTLVVYVSGSSDETSYLDTFDQRCNRACIHSQPVSQFTNRNRRTIQQFENY